MGQEFVPKRDPVAFPRDVEVVDPVRGLVQDLTDRVFETIPARDPMQDRELLTVGRPVGFGDFLQELPRRSPSERYNSERLSWKGKQRDLSGRGDGKNETPQSERSGFGSSNTGFVQLDWLAFPARAEHDRLTVRSESGGSDVTAPESELLERRQRAMGELLTGDQGCKSDRRGG